MRTHENLNEERVKGEDSCALFSSSTLYYLSTPVCSRKIYSRLFASKITKTSFWRVVLVKNDFFLDHIRPAT